MDLNKKRKRVVFSGLVIALAAAMYINWYYTRPTSSEKPQSEQSTAEASAALGDAQYVNATVKSSVFSESELKRSQLQDEVKQNYESVIENKQADEESKKVARENLEKLNKNIMLQGEIETIIKSKTGKNVFVTIGDTVEIIIEKNTLNSDIVLQIEDIVTKKADVPTEKITIIEAK